MAPGPGAATINAAAIVVYLQTTNANNFEIENMFWASITISRQGTLSLKCTDLIFHARPPLSDDSVQCSDRVTCSSHLQDDVPAAVEEQSPQLGDTQVLSVDLPQRGKATVRFEVKATSGTSSFIFASGTVFGAVNPASATTVRGFPHRVADINGERQGRGLVASVGANVRSIAARVTGVAVREYHPLLGTRQDGRVEPDGDNDADASPAPALLPSPCSSFVLKRDDDFMDAWEEFVRRDERCNNSVCWFVRNFDFPPLSSVVGVAMFFTPLWGMLFLFPLLWVLGVMACTLLLLATLTAVLMLLKELLSFPCHGDIGRSAVAVLHIIICALACYCVVMFGVYMPFGVIMTGECVLVYGLRYVLVTTLICCGVLKSDKVPPLEIAVEPQPPSWVPALDLAVEP